MTANELRTKYLEFFKSKGHTIIPSASLIPENDPTVLFTTAGMHPLVPFLMGQKHPAGQRLTDAQKCIRTTDIDEVGDANHHTFFEMLGNWSLGDYFKKEAIEWSWEFLTSPEYLGLHKNHLAVSVFAGDNDAPFDEEAFNIWKGIFRKNSLPVERIAKLPKKNNWWGLATGGPCGPDTEMFYWVGPEKAPASFNDDNHLWVEIWNDVFMQFNQQDGKLEPLAQKNVDTGMGLERALAVVNGLDDNYKTELFWPIIEKIEELAGKKYNASPETTRAMRIMADHIKAAIFMLAENLKPSNTERGYVLRRLIRRAVRYGKQLGINGVFTFKLIEPTLGIYKEVYSELTNNKDFIEEQLVREEEKFGKTLEKGLKELKRLIEAALAVSTRKGFVPPPAAGPSSMGLAGQGRLLGREVFDLFSTFGFPMEMTKEIAAERGLEIDEDGFWREFKNHQEISKAGSEQKFKGGLADTSEQTVKYHTAAHLMLAALRQVLGDHVFQKGSNITAERLRFDFSHPEKMSSEQVKQVEDLVNEQIQKDLPVVCEEMSLEEAKAKNAMGVFEQKYGKRVKVYTVGDPERVFSSEICGGPHIERTGQLGRFKIQKEESSSAGVRRIKAILE